MYNSNLLTERIQTLIKLKGKTQKNVLASCDLNENALNQMSDKRGISSFSLAKIADELDCSVDYLLGRTDTPNITIQSSNIVNVTGNNGSYSPLTVEKASADGMVSEFMQMFESLNFEDKVKAMSLVIELKDKER